VDYTDFEKEGKKKDPLAGLREGKPGFWWKEKNPADRAHMLQRAADELEKNQSDRHNANLLHARLYGNFDFASFGARQYMQGNLAGSSKVTYNVVQSATDTLAAKISKHRPRAVFLTDGAKWAEQQKAKRLGRFSDGMFSHAKVYEKDDLVFLDACVFGDGGYKIILDDDDKVNVERVFIDEILVDMADAKYGKPRQMFQVKLCHREKLLEMYPESADDIMAANPPDGVELAGFGDMIPVYEGWHLRSGKKSKDGCHVVCLDGGVELLGEKWELDRFPFVFFPFAPRLMGFWNQGVAEMLTGIQLEVNRVAQSICKQIQRRGKGRIFAPLASKVPSSHFDNSLAPVIYYNGNVPPHTDNQNAVASEEFMYLDQLYEKAYQIVGVSEMSVAAKKPSGLDAAVALREYEEIESERFAKQHQRWDRFHMELSEAMLDFVRVFGGEDYVTKYEHKRYMETIKWSDVKHSPGEYAIKMLPASSLPQLPGARRQAVKELLADGIIDMDTARALLDFPDLEAETNVANAARDDADAIIARILDEENAEVEMPEKYSNLEFLVMRGTAAYLFAKNHGADEDKLAKLSALIDASAAKILSSQKAPPPSVDPNMPVGPGEGGAPPPGPPMAPPPMPGGPPPGMPLPGGPPPGM
jgi:hypothetical protein